MFMLKKILYIFFGVAIVTSFSEQTIIYNKNTGDKDLKTVWTLERKKDLLFIEGQNVDQTILIEAHTPYDVQKYNVVSHKNSNRFTFIKKGNTLTAEGRRKGKDLKETYNISHKNWVQEFEFGFGPFLKSSDQDFKFVILNPKNFKLHDMIASKVGEEILTLNGSQVRALKVKVTLQGFKSMFWKGLIWYDLNNLAMLCYKANEGPHTPTTTITLLSNEGSPNAWYQTFWNKFKKESPDKDHTDNAVSPPMKEKCQNH